MPDEQGNKGLLGEIVGMFDEGPKIKEKPYSKVLKNLVNKDLADESRFNIAQRRKEQELFASKLKESEPLARDLQTERLGFLRNLTNSAASYDPMAQFKELGDYLYGQIGNLGGAARDAGKRSASDAAMALGLSPGASSGVVERVRQSGINDLLARTYGDTTRALNPAFGLITDSRSTERNAVQDLLERMAIEPDRFAARELLPSMARSAGQYRDIQNVQDLINAYVSNTAGFTSTPSMAGRISEGLGGIYGSVSGIADKALSAYGSMYGGGGGNSYGGAKPSSYGGGSTSGRGFAPRASAGDFTWGSPSASVGSTTWT